MLLTRPILSAVSLLLCLFCATPLLAQQAVWGLAASDRFRVETIIEQATTVRLDDGEPLTTKKTERLEVEYVCENSRGEETLIRAQIVSARRTDDGASATVRRRLKLIEQAETYLIVNQSGVLNNLGGHRKALQRVAEFDDSTVNMLTVAYPQEVFVSLIGRPFWLTVPQLPAKKDVTWERVDNMALGLMGTLRTIATCRIAEVEGNVAKIEITGQGRHVAPPPSTATAVRGRAFSDIQTSLKSFGGTGKMVVPTTDSEDEDLQPRPWLDAISLTWNIEGSATVTVADVVRKVTFTETQTQTSRLLPGYQVGTYLQPPAIRLPLRR